MELSGSEKEIGMQTSPPYNNHHHHHHHHHLIRESSSETVDHGSDPDRFPITGASVTPISVGSKLLKSPMNNNTPKYKECLKNHAANMGGNTTDGCCEFMPSGDDGTLEALKCAACNCHRNFHRKEYPITTHSPGPFLQLPPPLPSPSFHHRTPHHPLSLHHHHHHPNWPSSINASPVKVAFGGSIGGGGGGESSSEELNFTAGGVGPPPPYTVAKKRFRTKFSQQQKDKMMEFAEKVGWRIPREDDPEVQRFCNEVGVKRQVLKVWMHNNKATSGKKQLHDSIDTN